MTWVVRAGPPRLDLGVQQHLLSDPRREAIVANAVATHAYQCPLCYLKDREAHAQPGYVWPHRMRWLADVQRQCKGTQDGDACARLTFWCVAGAWEAGQKASMQDAK